jgi:hypothetical protein
MESWCPVSHSLIFGSISTRSVTVTGKFNKFLCSKNRVCLRLVGKSPGFPLQRVTIFGAPTSRNSDKRFVTGGHFQFVLLWFFCCCVQTFLIVDLFKDVQVCRVSWERPLAVSRQVCSHKRPRFMAQLPPPAPPSFWPFILFFSTMAWFCTGHKQKRQLHLRCYFLFAFVYTNLGPG